MCKFFFFLWFCISISTSAYAIPAFDISELSNETDITAAVGIFPDTQNKHELIPTQTSNALLDLNRFTPNHSPYIHFDKDIPTYWLNIALTNPSRREIVAYIKIKHLDLSNSTTYQALGKTPSNQDFYQTSNNILQSPEFSYLRIKVPAESSTQNLIKITSHSDTSQKLLYLTEQRYLEDINHANWLQGIFIGISITMALTLLYLYKTSTSPLPIYGVLVVTMLCLFEITYTGQLTRSLGLERAEHLGLFYVFYLISIGGYATLTCCLFNRRNFVIKYGHYCFALLIIFLVISFKINANHATTILLPTLVIICLLCLLGILAWTEKHPLAMNLLVTNIGVAFFLTTSTLDAYAILPSVFLLGFDDIATLSLMSGFITTSIGKILFLNAQTTNRIYREDKVKQELRNAKNTFLAQFSHEMRTPLNGVLGMTELILDTPLSNNQREYINTIQESGNKLMIMINDVIDFTRLESGELSLSNKTFELHQVIQDSLNDFIHEAEQKQIELICDIEDGLPRYVEGDNERLRQVLNGLVNHLISLIEHGEIVVSVSRDNATNNVNFRIRDTGIGLHKNGHDSLFDAYQQTKTHIKPFDLSLDLSMIQELVRLMGGELQMASEFGKGNVVWFSLKLEASDIQAEDEYDDSVLHGLNLLTVDDNAAICKVISYHAHSWGMKASSASSGSETLAQLRSKASLNERIDVVILDYKMPVMNGIELAAKIKEDNLITNDVLVIMLTGLNFTPNTAALKNAGIRHILTKPVSGQALKQVILKGLGHISHPNNPARNSHFEPIFPQGGLKVLVAEDNQVSTKVICGMLRKLGAEYHTATNGEQAYNTFISHQEQKQPFGMVLMDCEMPVMDGFEATQSIRDWEKRHKLNETPIVALSAHVLPQQKALCMDSGMNDYIEKPIELSTLRNKLMEWAPPITADTTNYKDS